MVAIRRWSYALPRRCARLVLAACLALPVPLSAQAPGSAGSPPRDKEQIDTVEYYNAALGHYFVTGIPKEISNLDEGKPPGWVRTGEKFNVWYDPEDGLSEVCRFFSEAFAPKSSHFYTALAHECTALKAGTTWGYEGVVAYVRLPTPAGACPGETPLYRLYNNVLTGAPNHRYTRSKAIRDQMIELGWTSEGFGADGVIACVPNG